MPIIKTTLLYKFEELSDKAKEKARDWWREHIFQDASDWENVFEDAVQCAKALGIEISARNQKCGSTTRDGKHKEWVDTSPSIFFSGFSSQGDGACFEGKYKYVEDAEKSIKEHAPQDERLHRIGRDLDVLQKKYKNSLSAVMKQSGHYYHAYCMSVDVDVECRPDEGDDIEVTIEDEKALAETMRDFANWIYHQLEAENDYQNKDDVIDENICANEYTFTVDGKRESE